MLEHMHWISEALIQTLAEAPSHLQIDVRIQLTCQDIAEVLPTLEKTSQRGEGSDDDLSLPSSPDGSKVDADDKEDIDSEPELAKMKGVRILKGRPDIHGILDEEVSCAEGPVSVDGEWTSLWRDMICGTDRSIGGSLWTACIVRGCSFRVFVCYCGSDGCA
jgi:hypothetical protein